MHASTEDTIVDKKDWFYEELERVVNQINSLSIKQHFFQETATRK
jgi:hypothetical protein